jgi:hypothetical protein
LRNSVEQERLLPPPDQAVVRNGFDVPRWVCSDPLRRALMSEIITVGLDLAKYVFQVNEADGTGRAVLRKKLRREQVFFWCPERGANPPT